VTVRVLQALSVVVVVCIVLAEFTPIPDALLFAGGMLAGLLILRAA
jgi:hypothetical protein